MEFYKQNSRELYKLFSTLQRVQKETDGDVSLEQFILAYHTDYPVLKDDERAYIDKFVDTINNLTYKEADALELLQKHHEKTVASEIAIMALNISQGKGSISEIENLLSTVESVQPMEEFSFVSDDLFVLKEAIRGEGGLRWRLETFNKSLGSLRKGDFGFFYARPETGKTTMLASEATFMAEQIANMGDGCVLWFNNEEQGDKVKTRCFQAMYGATTHELYGDNYEHYRNHWLENWSNRIRILEEKRITSKLVEQVCAKYNPKLIIFDQLDKIVWGESERNDLKLKAIYQWAREISAAYAPFIAVCQAGGSAEGKKYLDMNDVDSSSTAKQGEADFMFGIGKSHDEKEESQRFISISKNKLIGDEDSVEDMRHAKVPVIIQPTIARYQDFVRF
jgi:replicative DNA helicase